MTRLPSPGADDGVWGQLLNDFLSQAHDIDGDLKSDSVGSAQLQDNSVTNTKLADGIDADKLVAGTANKLYSAAEKTKLADLKNTEAGLFAAEIGARANTAQAQYARSLGNAMIAREDGAEIREFWVDDMAFWSDNTIATAVNDELQTNGGGGGANREFVVAGNQNVRAVTTFEYPGAAGGSGSEWVFFGFSSDPAGGTYSLGGHFAIGIEVKSGIVQGWNGSATTDLPGALVAGQYVVTATADQETVNFTISRVGTLDRWQYDLPRSHGDINNIAIWLSDSRGSNGVKMGVIGAKVGGGTTSPPIGEKGLPSAHYGKVASGPNARIRYMLPAGFDSRRPTPMVIGFHGAGGDVHSEGVLEYDCVYRGYIYVAADGGAPDSAGNSDAVDMYTAVYEYMLDRFPISSVALISESMGGTTGGNTLSHRGIPLPACWIGYYPLLNLIWAWSGNTAAHDALIAHYGVNPDGSDLTEKVEGYSPVQADPKQFAGVPMLVFHSYGDTVVTKADNIDRFALALEGYSEVTVVETQGEHGDNSNFTGPNTQRALDFLDRHLGR